MCVSRNGLPLDQGLAAIEREFEAHGTAEDREALHYVLHGSCGESPRTFPNSPYPRDCDADGVRPDRRQPNGDGMRLVDFVEHPLSRAARLEVAHVAALRLYTTAAYHSLNGPLRDVRRVHRSKPHRLPVTVCFLDQAIRQLRANEAPKAAKRSGGATAEAAEDPSPFADRTLYRGLRDVRVPDEFMAHGGSARHDVHYERLERRDALLRERRLRAAALAHRVLHGAWR